MDHGFDFGQEMRAWVSPSLIEANYILSLSRMELENVIAAEMEANPALEADERASCPLCGGVLDGTFCTTCLVSQAPPTETESYEDFPETMLTERAADGDEFDPMTLIAHAMSLPEQILADARTVLEPHEYHIAEFLVDAIDDRGFLTVSLEEAAELLGIVVQMVETVLEVIQDVAPIGVGARDLQECLLLQLRHLEPSGEEIPPRVNEIVTHHLDAFGAHKFGQIARALDVSTDEVEAARDFIRNHLNPFPLQAQQARWWRSPSDAVYVAPDVIITIKDEALHVEVVDAKHFHLKMNSLYSQLATEMGGRRPSRAKAARAAPQAAAPVTAPPAPPRGLKERLKAQAQIQREAQETLAAEAWEAEEARRAAVADAGTTAAAAAAPAEDAAPATTLAGLTRHDGTAVTHASNGTGSHPIGAHHHGGDGVDGADGATTVATLDAIADTSAPDGGHQEPDANLPTAGTAAPPVAKTVDDDRAHVRQYSNRARIFISNIQQRRETLLKITFCLCELQQDFLRGGVRELRPLTRAVVAQQVGVHESTVSRATASKYVMLPNRRVIPFSDFFTPSLSTKDVIKELIQRESQSGTPLTDRRICDLLLNDGIRIARRTVAKYRAELGILPSTMR